MPQPKLPGKRNSWQIADFCQPSCSKNAAQVIAVAAFTYRIPLKLLPQQMVAYYDQRWGKPEILTIEPLLNVLKLTLECIRCGGEFAENTKYSPPMVRELPVNS